MKKFKLLFIFASLLLPALTFSLQGQDILRGTVTGKSGEGLPGVTVVVSSTGNSVLTDIMGEYVLYNVKPGEKIRFEYLGYKTQETVWSRGTLNISLKEKNAARWVVGHEVGAIRPTGSEWQTSLGSFVGYYNINQSRFGADLHVSFPFIVLSPNLVFRVADRFFLRAGPVYNCYDKLGKGLGVNGGLSFLVGSHIVINADGQFYGSSYFAPTDSRQKCLAFKVGIGWAF
jgi:hypothetical protein